MTTLLAAIAFLAESTEINSTKPLCYNNVIDMTFIINIKKKLKKMINIVYYLKKKKKKIFYIYNTSIEK